MQKALSKLLKTGCFSIRQRLCISAEEPASATVQDKTIWFGFFVPHSSLKGRREGMGCFYPFWTLKLVILPWKQPQMLSISPPSQRLELSESLGDISCQCMCPALINANESCVHEERGSLFVCEGLAFTARSLAQTWPTILIGFWGLAQWLAPRYERQRAQHNSSSSGTISSSGSSAKAPILHPFGGLFSLKTDSKLWHKRYQAYYIVITVNGKN